MYSILSTTSPLTELAGVGPVLASRLKRLGLATVEDLLTYFPTRYEDFSKLAPIAKLPVGERVTIAGRVQVVSTRRARRRRLTITEALVSDSTGTVKAVWFNQPYLAKSLLPGNTVLLAGKLVSSSYGLQLEQPTWEKEERGSIHTSRLVPLYPLTAQLSHRQLRSLVARVLPLAHALPDWLPPPVREQAKLMALPEAITALHFPKNVTELTAARRRVTFNELYLMHLAARRARQALGRTAPRIPFAPPTREFVAQLPWPLTPDQRVAAWQVLQDMGRRQPMLRLLQGDVGSGKTIVAGLAAFNAAAAGWQMALLAPTEILAHQHFTTLERLFRDWPVRVGLLTRGYHRLAGEKTASAATVRARAARGQLDVLVGTHALLQSPVSFHRLGLVVVDEQHRFGVHARQALAGAAGGVVPHFLSLSATPIPRSLALTLFGDLELSVLKTLPPGRQPITTTIVPPAGRPRAYELMRREIAKGNRVFIVCPLIDESDEGGVRAATAERERLQREVFPHTPVELLHGRMPSKDKTAVMHRFQSGEAPVLVSTTVVEVGVDVPAATIMAVEGAERFGLAQLHQLRGRVGRSERPSTCLLLTETEAGARHPRLAAAARFSSGFALAEFDLKHRGPGDLLGDVQSGWLKLRFAELADLALMDLVRQAGSRTLALDPTLRMFPQLLDKLRELTVHPE